MTRRNNSVEPNLLTHRPYRDTWPPACPRNCGFVGEYNDTQSPYIACEHDALNAEHRNHQKAREEMRP